jgi:hypothetical protein
MVMTAANRFFSKSLQEQMGTLTDLLTSAGRRAVNLLANQNSSTREAQETEAEIDLARKLV